MGLTEGLIAGASLAQRKRESAQHQQNVETQQGFAGLEILNALSQHEATADAALDGLLAKRSPLVQEESAASAMLSLAEMSKDPGTKARAQARHAKAVGALDELDSFLNGAARQKEVFSNQSSMTRDFLTRNGLLSGLLEAKGTHEQLNQPSQSQQQPAPFTMPGMQQAKPQGGGSSGSDPGLMLTQPQDTGLDISQSGFATPSVGGVDPGQQTPAGQQAAASVNPSAPQDQVLSMWDQQASQVGLPPIGSPEARVENGTIVYTTNDSDIAKNWEQRIGKLGEFVGGTPPMVVKDRGKVLETAVKDTKEWARLVGTEQSRVSAFQRAKAAPQNVQDMQIMMEMSGGPGGNSEDVSTWQRVINADEKDRVRILNEAIEAVQPQLDLWKGFLDRSKSLAEEHYDLIGAGALNPAKAAPKGTAAPAMDKDAWLADYEQANGKAPTDPKKRQAYLAALKSAWEAAGGR